MAIFKCIYTSILVYLRYIFRSIFILLNNKIQSNRGIFKLEKLLKEIIYRLDYLEFRQNLLILKEPCHKISLFFDLDINTYINMKVFSNEFSQKVKNGHPLNIQDYEKSLIKIWPEITTYPSSYIIIAKSLLPKEILNTIINYK